MRFVTLCNSEIKNYINRSQYLQLLNICIDFLKNLDLLYNDNYKNDDASSKYCNNIYYWLYNKINEQYNYKESINKLIDAKKKLLEYKKNIFDCYEPTLYDDLDKAENFVMLSIFNNNIDTIQDILTTKYEYILCECLNFINKCVSIYKSIKKF
ncbi:hypothetical protein PCYB_007610 [Plasmodium cynomolgi strain B]|uniref:CYIR protein n=1 Tax=Plasmodium cynomolgi (strain B) TaxID=1120755 RepID=K6VKR0_PLACD|nr:hypothetical protein PCYB_007610 [Plasmodium cynomolgi strain B]GAB70012.1 hypothetical protein PCYB_007610 [Plasmodium cynomolgi strain B]